jgi:hypothetical protein
MRSIPLLLVTLFALSTTGCGSSSPPTAAKTEPAPPPVKDNISLLPGEGRISAQVVPNHLLDIAALPGGTLGDYKVGKKKYQLFIIEADSNQKAAFMDTDLRDALKSPEYIAYMGGYFGERNGTPIYGFAKLQYLAGVVGLPKDEADPIARQLAARLH